MISSIFLIACGFSIFAITFVLYPLSLIRFFSSKISFALLTKDNAIQSTSFLRPKFKSLMSFSVTDDNLISLSGRFTPFLSKRIPPLTTIASNCLSSLLTTFNSILPSSINIFSPILISPITLLSIHIEFWLPIIFLEVTERVLPSFKTICSLSNFPTRIFGPCRSCNIVIGTPNSSLIFLTFDITFL